MGGRPQVVVEEKAAEAKMVGARVPVGVRGPKPGTSQSGGGGAGGSVGGGGSGTGGRQPGK